MAGIKPIIPNPNEETDKYTLIHFKYNIILSYKYIR